MANILCFDKNLPDDGAVPPVPHAQIQTERLDNQTYEVAQAEVVNVERDNGDSVTVYFRETNGKTWYVTFNNAELELIQQVK